MTIHNGRDLQRHAGAVEIPRKEACVISVGRFWDEAKNLTALDAAAAHVRWPVKIAGATAGPGGSGVAAAHAQLLGELAPDAIADHLGRAAIFASPAKYEPFGLAALEAAMSGCALVLGDIATLREVWGQAAVYVDPRRRKPVQLYFHDTHHRSISRPEEIAAFDLAHYDGVLAFGRVIAEDYQRRGRARHVWTWHEAADTTVFHPRPRIGPEADLVWIGNWGDEERTAELHEYLFEPIRRLKLRATIHGVGYPRAIQKMLADRGIRYGGYLPNFQVPEVFAKHRLTVHVPRRPYAEALPGIPTIRPFEAMACGIAMVSAPWQDMEGLFHVGRDFQMVHDGQAMTDALDRLLTHPAACQQQARHALGTLLSRHTCGHRADELLSICEGLNNVSAGVPDTSAVL